MRMQKEHKKQELEFRKRVGRTHDSKNEEKKTRREMRKKEVEGMQRRIEEVEEKQSDGSEDKVSKNRRV